MEGSVSRIGAAVGTWKSQFLSLPVDGLIEIDPNGPRTSSRAELLAAWLGIALLEAEHGQAASRRQDNTPPGGMARWVIASDSEYVVKGITEWMPAWKKNGWRRKHGQELANLDLFQKIDDVISEKEAQGIQLGLW
jgi:ribonuclease HI